MSILIAAVSAAVGIGALLIGAGIAWRWALPRRAVAGVMAFGAGVLIATLTLELVTEAKDGVGVWPVVVGFTCGAVGYVVLDGLVDRLAKRQGARSSSRNATAQRGGDSEGGGLSIAVGALLDGIPEAIVIGLSALTGGFPVGLVVAIGLSNVPEGLAGTVPLKRAGRPLRFVLALWGGITLLGALAATLGASVLLAASPAVIAVVISTAAGALLAMVANAMIPEAYEEDHWATGLIVTAGFLVAFVLGELT